MSSIGGTRLAMCMQRYGPLAWASMLCCHRQGSKVASLMVPLNGAAHPTGCRRMSTIAGRKNTEPFGVDLQDFRRELKVAEKIRKFRRFIADPSMAKTLLKCLQPWDDRGNRPIILECDPGPGVFTQTLLAAGARVVALESNKDFLPSLKDLQNNMDGQLEVLHCDFFKLDPLGHGTMQPPVMYSNVLFNSLCIPEVPWTKDVPFKVFGILPQKTESAFLWKQIYNLYERNSIYRYGRIELNVFLSEKQYMEPWSSFLTPLRFKGAAIPRSVIVPNDHLCLVRITPRRDLFTDSLTRENGNTFIVMVKQCLGKRKAKLVDRLNSWDPGNGHKLLKKLALPEDIQTGDVTPEQYKQLFEAMGCSEEFNKSWIFDETLEDLQQNAFSM
ncbi:dimethyladenosine transferase 2, mitochondrial isoform X2 [Xenopus laevis]|uniref:rRNA adenine N(6)-methyltransferase n=1 Tax=Xenopus laevis TaxID=8355 RepID=A0A8J1KN05_XENLA|nr:dimethyladenosine transferase 2, mitochondrial isoform X2 [Xenopus laevis]